MRHSGGARKQTDYSGYPKTHHFLPTYHFNPYHAKPIGNPSFNFTCNFLYLSISITGAMLGISGLGVGLNCSDFS